MGGLDEGIGVVAAVFFIVAGAAAEGAGVALKDVKVVLCWHCKERKEDQSRENVVMQVD